MSPHRDLGSTPSFGLLDGTNQRHRAQADGPTVALMLGTQNPARTRLASIAVLAVVLTVVSGCAHGSTLRPQEAKRSVVDQVDRTASAIGGTWTVVDGPEIESCSRSGGGRGARYAYEKTRDVTGDSRDDATSARRLWTGWGLEVASMTAEWNPPAPQIRGYGDHGAFIDFLASPARYSIQGASECMDRDADSLRRPPPGFEFRCFPELDGTCDDENMRKGRQ